MTVEEIEKIRKHSNLQFSAAEVEILCELPEGAINRDPVAQHAYMHGVLLAQAMVRQHLLNRVKEGDSMAIRQFFQLSEGLGFEIDHE